MAKAPRSQSTRSGRPLAGTVETETAWHPTAVRKRFNFILWAMVMIDFLIILFESIARDAFTPTSLIFAALFLLLSVGASSGRGPARWMLSVSRILWAAITIVLMLLWVVRSEYDPGTLSVSVSCLLRLLLIAGSIYLIADRRIPFALKHRMR